MKEFEYTFDKGLMSGLRKHFTNPRNEQALVELHNWMPTEAGLVVHEAVVDLNVSSYAWGGRGKMACLPEPMELLLNPDFETGSPPSNWTASNSGVLARAGSAHSGSYCLKITCGVMVDNPVAYQLVSCMHELTTYRLTCWVKQGTATSYRVRAYDYTNTTQLAYSDGTATASWIEVTLDFTTLTGTEQIYVELYHLATAGDGTYLYFDDARLRRIS